MAKRSYPTSKDRGRSREDPMPEGWWLRGTTPRLRSGVAVEWNYPTSKVGAAAERSYPASEVRSGGQECQAVTAQ